MYVRVTGREKRLRHSWKDAMATAIKGCLDSLVTEPKLADVRARAPVARGRPLPSALQPGRERAGRWSRAEGQSHRDRRCACVARLCPRISGTPMRLAPPSIPESPSGRKLGFRLGLMGLLLSGAREGGSGPSPSLQEVSLASGSSLPSV